MNKLIEAMSHAIADKLADRLNIKVIEVAKIEIEKLELKPGDIIVLKSKHVLSERAYMNLKDSMDKIFPNHEHQVLILEEDLDIMVVSK